MEDWIIMTRWTKDRKLEVIIELEKLDNIRFDLLWNYLNFELLRVRNSDDERFVRADKFSENIDTLLRSRVPLKKEVLGEEYKDKLIL